MRKEYASEARNLLHNEYQNLTIQGFAKKDQKTLRAVQWTISCAGNLDSAFGKDVKEEWEKYKEIGLNNESAYQNFMEWVYKLDADLDTYFKSNWKSHTQPLSKDSYVNEEIMKGFQSKSNTFNFEKLISLIEEINFNFAHDKIYATSMILRAILDHIPPLLGKTNFEEVVSQHNWGSQKSSKRRGVKTLLDFRNIPDDVLHSQISNKKDILDMTYLPNKFAINTLLQECLESDAEFTPSKTNQKENHSSKKIRIPEHYPAVGVSIEMSGGNPYSIKLSFVNTGDKPAILEELKIGNDIKIPLNKMSMLAANNEPRQFGELPLEGSDVRMGTITNPKLIMTYRDMAGTRYKSEYNILTKKRADEHFNVDGLADLNIEVIE